LASGRPVTFQMDLYRPLMAERQTVPPCVPPLLASRVYSPDLADLDMNYPLERFGAGGTAPGLPPSPVNGPSGRGGGMGGLAFGGGMGGKGGGMGGFGGGMGGMAGMAGPEDGQGAGGAAKAPFDPTQGVVAQASAEEIAEQFVYRIDQPVSLARRRSALIPIVDQDIETEKLSIFTAGEDEEHPMLAFRMKNTTGFPLTGGPITVFDAGAYAGDARITFLRAGESRLISFAQDVDLNVRSTQDEQTKSVEEAGVELGIVNISYDVRRAHRYRVQSKSDSLRTLVLEQPRDVAWKLADDQTPSETTDSHYRFEVKVPAGKTVETVIVEQQTQHEQLNLMTIDDEALKRLAHRTDLPANVLAVVNQVRQLRVSIAELESALKLEQQLLADIGAEQARIRGNMSTLGKDSELFKRYVEKLTAQEDKFDAARDKLVQLRTDLATKRWQLAQLFSSSDKAAPATDGAGAEDPFGENARSG